MRHTTNRYMQGGLIHRHRVAKLVGRRLLGDTMSVTVTRHLIHVELLDRKDGRPYVAHDAPARRHVRRRR